MKDINHSLLIAVLACVAMGLFAKSTQLDRGQTWITKAFLLATLGLCSWGFWVGLRGALRQRTAWSWLAPAVNVLILITIVTFFSLILIALRDFQ